ncbi:MAG: GNAT family N-acetyltransferase [Clostridiales bacterium]|nr:GNAT family N-acetyltransferase [Clostridiales bacterium]
MESLKIRTAAYEDLEGIAEIEKECFPIVEAASKQLFKERIRFYGNHFLVLEFGGVIADFINGLVSDSEVITDEMYEKPCFHNKSGKYQAVFGLDVAPKYRNNGFSALLMNALISKAKNEKRQGVILTCKEHMIVFYEKFGFKNKGISESIHGGAEWYDMILKF